MRLVRQTAGRRSVAITTWASFCIDVAHPRLEEFQRDHPGIDIRIDASDAQLDLDTSDVGPGPALQRAQPRHARRHAPVWRAAGRGGQPLAAQRQARAAHTGRCGPVHLIEASDAHRSAHLEWLSWRRWLDIHGVDKLQPERWLYFNYAHQIARPP